MPKAVVTLQPFNGHTGAFSIWQNTFPNPSDAVVSDELSSGQWVVEGGEIWIVWGGWFNASHHHEGGTLYRVNLNDCVDSSPLDIGYQGIPGKQPSITVTCLPETPAATAPTLPPETTTTSAPPITAPPAPTATTEPPGAPTGQPDATILLTSATTPGPTYTVADCVEYNVPVSDPKAFGFTDGDGDGFVCDNVTCTVNCGYAGAELPETGSDLTLAGSGAGLLLLGSMLFALSRKVFANRA